MSRPGKTVVWILVALLVAYAGYQTYARIRERAAAGAMSKEPAGPLKVGVRRVGKGTLTLTVTTTGEILALTSVEVVPRIGGTLESLRRGDGTKLDEGVPVKSGEVIAVIEHRSLDASVQMAKASLTRAQVQAKPEVVEATVADARAAVAAAKAQLAEAGANARQMQREKERMQKLFDQGSTTEQMRDQAATAHEASAEREKALRAMVQRAEAAAVLAESLTKALADASVMQAEAALRQTEVALDDATIEAPISGVISKKHVDEGDMVGPATPLVCIDQIDTVKAIGGVSERHLAALIPGKTPVQVTVDAYPDEVFAGEMHLVGAGIDRATRTAKVEARIANPGGRLKPGTFARMRVGIARRENVVVVSDDALVNVDGTSYAWVVENGRAKRRTVTLALAEGTRHEVLEGLAEGETVIVRGQTQLKENDAVTTVEIEETQP